MNFIGYIIFLITGVICCISSTRLLKIKLTFTNAVTVPYLCICTIQILICYYLRLPLPIIEYWLILSIFTISVLTFECLAQYWFNNGVVACNISKVSGKDIYKNNTLFNIIIVITILYCFYSTWKLISNTNIALLLQVEFQDQYQKSGAGSLYSRLLLMILSVYLLTFRKGLIWKILGCLSFIPNLVINTKGIIFIQILAILVVLIILRKIRNIYKLSIGVILIGILIFFGSYAYEGYLSNWDLADSSFWNKTFTKLIIYVTGGVQAFNYNLVHCNDELIFSIYPNATLVPFNNFLAKFGLTQSYSSVTDFSVPIWTDGGTTNVNSMYGTIFLFDGLIGGIIIIGFWVILSSFIRYRAFKSGNPIDVVLFGLFYTPYLLGWFDFYFMQTFWIYIILIAIILRICLKINISKWKVIQL